MSINHRKAVLVTGASSGIGRTCALELDRAGYRVFATVRKETDAESLRQAASEALTPIFMDVTDESSIATAVSTVAQAVGEAGLTGLVNNAGVGIPGPLEYLAADDLRRQFEINVVGQVMVTQAFLPLIRQAQGRIINIGSVGGKITMPFGGALEKGITLGQAGGHPHIQISGHVWLAWLRQTQGDVTGGQKAIQAALQLIQQYEVGRFWPIPPAACTQVRLWLAQGNLAAASRWAQTNGLNQVDTPLPYLYEADYLTLARLWMAQGDLEAAESLLLRLHRAAAAAGRSGGLIEILILQAITFSAQRRREEALSALEQALRRAEPEGFVRIFLDEGASLTELLRQAVAQGVHAAYALQLLNVIEEVVLAPQPLIEPLSERKLEVLRRVAAGFSNQEIARDLVIAVGTVKKHLNTIYGKIEVESRTQAVAKARDLNLL